jgi:hypothetical protein
MLTVLTQMPAFISVNRSERLPTLATVVGTRTVRTWRGEQRSSEIPRR